MAKRTSMRTIAVRNIVSHKLRLALTVLSVMLGTAFISGAFMFTNSLSSTFEAAVGSAYEDVDAAVGPAEGLPIIDGETVQAITDDELVRAVNLTESTNVVVANENLEAYQVGGGTSTLQMYYPPENKVGDADEIIDGVAPHGEGEVIVNDTAAEEQGISVGEKIILVTPEERYEVTVSGIYTPALEQGLGSLSVLMEAGSYQNLFNPDGLASQMAVAAHDGTTAEQLVNHLNETYPQVEAQTGQALADELTEQISNALSFVNYFLVAFGLIGLLVGTFIIANTFSMIVAQRIKEFALLRSIGASQRQITGSVVVEALVVGLLGSALGVVAGIGLVAVIRAVFSARGMSFDGGGLGLSLTAIVLPIILGVVVTIASAWAPARRAGQVKPVEAMRSTESAAGAPLTVRTIIGTVIIVAGVLAAGLAMLLDDSGTTLRASLVGIGAFLVVVGYFMAGPAFSMGIVPVLGRVIGAPFGSMGRLASTNARRSPRRTAATAFALTLGMMLVTGIGMLGATMKNSIGDMLEDTVTADFLATGPQDGSFPVPQAVPGALAETDGVESTVTMRMAPVQIAGQAGYNYGPGYTFTNSIDGSPQDFVDMEILEGSADLVAQPGVLVSDELAKAEGWTVGQALPLTTLETAESSDESGEPVAVEPGHETEVTITGIYSSENDIFENLLVSQSAVDEVMEGDTAPIQMIAINTDDSVGEDEMRERLVESVKEFLVIQVKTGAEYADEASQLIDQMLSILYALLALAVIIAVLGIINTLTLGVIERRQEIGMLRAVGAYRGQIRTMIIVEAVQIALFGAIMGILAGLGLGWAFIGVLAGEGLGGAVIPWNQVLIMLGGAAVVGVVSALWPARKAAKTPPLEAIAD